MIVIVAVVMTLKIEMTTMLSINLGSCKGKDNIGQVSRKRGVVKISHL